MLISPSLPAFATNSIAVCCAWNTKLGDGNLTYKISGGDATSTQAVRNAIEDWDNKLSDLTLTETTDSKSSFDIWVHFKRGGGTIAGLALYNFDSNGFITFVSIQISGKAFGIPNAALIIEQITKHEAGHALGLGHANFDDDLMSPVMQNSVNTISTCNINGVLAAQHWYLVDNITTPHKPHVDHIDC